MLTKGFSAKEHWRACETGRAKVRDRQVGTSMHMHGRTHTHTYQTIHIYVGIQWHGSWWQPLWWHPQASGSVLCVSLLYEHTPASLIRPGYTRLLCHHEMLLFGYDRCFTVYVFARCCSCGWYNKLAKWLNYAPAANSPKEYAFTVAKQTQLWHKRTRIHFSCLVVFWSLKARFIFLSHSIVSSKVVGTTAALLFPLPAF